MRGTGQGLGEGERGGEAHLHHLCQATLQAEGRLLIGVKVAHNAGHFEAKENLRMFHIGVKTYFIFISHAHLARAHSLLLLLWRGLGLILERWWNSIFSLQAFDLVSLYRAHRAAPCLRSPSGHSRDLVCPAVIPRERQSPLPPGLLAPPPCCPCSRTLASDSRPAGPGCQRCIRD